MWSPKKLTVLKWFDILILTIILFGDGIINSTLQYIALQNQTTTLQENLTFSPMDNYKALALQLVWLTIAIFYLLLEILISQFGKTYFYYSLGSITSYCLIHFFCIMLGYLSSSILSVSSFQHSIHVSTIS